ncbi:hypothetical protein RIF29_15352 [Crotalaria pallida]|uniref:BAG domain-containing protein n=1 Tax=Crotalaria pallida TaxID=3830 RepID=A0AAN9IDI3_CROPI
MPFPHCYHPGIEAIPPPMKLEPSKSPFPYEQTWPYAGAYGQSIPMHSCCSHNNYPGYYSYRPYPPPAPVPSPIYHSGCYPANGEPFFVPYSPQPHCTMELPRYEYDKYMPRGYHCCGCPNHPCQQKELQSVKIEEQEPDAGNKENDALVPTQLKNYPRPFVLIPPEHASNGEMRNPVKAETGERHKISHDRKPAGPGYFRADGQEPRIYNGWFPFDMNGVPQIDQEGDGKRNQNRESGNDNRRESDDGRVNQKPQGERKRPEFPFPIIWMPYYNKQEEGGKTNNKESASTPKYIEEVPSTFKAVPANSHADEVVAQGNKSAQDKSTNATGSDVTEKTNNERIIPVQQVVLHQGKDDSEGRGKKIRNITVNQREDMAKNDSHTSGESQPERQSASPRKTSKLPPVCLRVDPLPRKKNGNGNSRSPSPPASKGHSQSAAGETAKTSSGGMNDKAKPNSNCRNPPNTGEKVNPKERTIPVSANKNNVSSQSSSLSASKEHPQTAAGETSKISYGGMNDQAQLQLQNAPNSEKVKQQERTILVTENRTSEHKAAESGTDGNKEETEIEKGAGNMMEEANVLKQVTDSSKPTDEGKREKKVLSDIDAAVLIQAVYRGYQVRKWEPLKKIKQLAEVNKEVTDVKGCVQAFEKSFDLQSVEKQRIAIGETIMRLLLKLDTIQGLHPSLRETRKSMARELISLQERLDSVNAEKPQQQMQESEDTPLNVHYGENVQSQQEEISVPREVSSEGTGHGDQDASEECHIQSCMNYCINNNLPADDSGSESQSQIDTTSNEMKEPIELPNVIVDEVVSVDACNSASDLSEANKMAVKHEAKSNVNDIPIEDDKLDNMDTLKELPVEVVEEDKAKSNVNDILIEDDKLDNMDTLKELPVEVVEEDTIIVSSVKDEQNEKENAEDMDKRLPTAVDADMIELPVALLDEDTTTPECQKDDDAKILIEEPPTEEGECMVELPVGLLDEVHTEKSEFEKNDVTKASEEALPAEATERNVKSSSADETAKEIQLELEQQQQLEKQEEVQLQSPGESDGWVKIEFQEEGARNELKRDAPLHTEVESYPGEKIGNEANARFLEAQVNCHEQENGNECLEANDVKSIQPEPMETVMSTQEDESIKGEEKKVAESETQVESKDLVLKDTEALAKDEVDLSAAAPKDGGSDGDKKLVEENEKLREMMKKLLDAGNEQLNVISTLTGRVKDLEKKLARSKRVRTKRYKPASASKTRSNNALKH